MADEANNSTNGSGTATPAASGETPDSGRSNSTSVIILAVAIALMASFKIMRARTKEDRARSTGMRVLSAAGTAASPSSTAPSRVPQQVPVVFAAVVRATQARMAAGAPEQASSLFRGAVMCWTGSEAEWSRCVVEMDLPQLPSWSPEGDDRVIATYRAEEHAGDNPRNSLGIPRSLSKLASDGRLKSGNLYGRPLGIDPSRFGFKEF